MTRREFIISPEMNFASHANRVADLYANSASWDCVPLARALRVYCDNTFRDEQNGRIFLRAIRRHYRRNSGEREKWSQFSRGDGGNRREQIMSLLGDFANRQAECPVNTNQQGAATMPNNQSETRGRTPQNPQQTISDLEAVIGKLKASETANLRKEITAHSGEDIGRRRAMTRAVRRAGVPGGKKLAVFSKESSKEDQVTLAGAAVTQLRQRGSEDNSGDGDAGGSQE